MNIAYEIYNNLTKAQVNAYLWWQGCGDDDLTNFSVIDVKGNIGKRFWALRQYYRFVRPGAVRIKATPATADTNLLVTAFKRTITGGEANWAIVLANRLTTPKGIRLAGTGLPATFDLYQTSASLNGTKLNSISNTDSLTLPGKSITTLVSGDFHGGIDISTGNGVGVANRESRSAVTARTSAPLRLLRKADALMVEYDVTVPAAVRISVVSISGRAIETLIDDSLVPGGRYQVSFKPAGGLGTGVYIVKATIGDQAFSVQSAMPTEHR
jgi:hypothetical protein